MAGQPQTAVHGSDQPILPSPRPPWTPSTARESPDLAAMAARVASLGNVLEEARSLLIDETTDTGSSSLRQAPLSVAERKKRTQKLLHSLKVAAGQLPPLCRRLERLQEASQPKGGRGVRQASICDLASAAKLRQLQADKQQEAEAQLLEEKAKAAEAEAQKLQQVLSDGAAEYESAMGRAAAAEARLQRLVAEHAALQRKAKETAEQLAATSSRAEQTARAEERHRRAVAKLTADNVGQLLRLRRCEAEREALAVELAEKRGPWLEQVEAEVERRVGSDLARVNELEAELERARQQQRQAEEASAAERAWLLETLGKAEGEAGRLASQLQEARQLASRSAAAAAAAEASSAAALQRSEAAVSEAAQHAARLQQLEEAAQSSKAAEQAAKVQVGSLEAKLAQLEAAQAALQAELKARSVAVEREREMNRQLMQRKQDTEWQLMEALSRLPADVPA